MKIDDDGYKVEMTVGDVAGTFCEWYNPPSNAGVWIASCFGPVSSHEIIAFKTKREAFDWVLSNMGSQLGENGMVDEMCPDCWKDRYDSGTEWEVRFLEIPFGLI